MPRANRVFLPGHVLHITHRCHDREFLLGAACDRDNWRRWLWTATSRYGLCVLNYVTTSNHVHLLVHDASGDKVISRSMQLVQGRTAQGYNRRRGRHGAYWQDRYHAVLVDTDKHLWRCLAYIDLNMVRARAVEHPRDWRHGGYSEIQHPRSRYRVLDLERLASLTGCATVGALQAAHRELVESSLASADRSRDARWSESVAVGSEAFVESVCTRLGLSRVGRVREAADHGHVLREEPGPYAGIRCGEIRD